MGFELDKHDLFRTAVPGFIFLFVLFSFYLFNHNLILIPTDNINIYLSIMVLAITLPIGYLIHNIYRAIHVVAGELKRWERYESDRIKEILSIEQVKELKFDQSNEDKGLSWLVETCLHIKSSEPIRERGYQLITRVHSSGSSITAIALAIIFSIFYLYNCRGDFKEYWQINLFLSVVWIVVIIFLDQARATALDGYKILIKYFIDIRHQLIIDVATKELDPFGK